MKTLILSDGIPGHVNQSRGVSSLLAESITIDESIIVLKPKIYFLRSPIKLLARALCKNLTNIKSRIIVNLFQSIDVSNIELVIAAGGNTAAYSAALSFLNKIPNIQLGSPRGIHSNNFNAHLTIDKYFDTPNNIVVDITPNLYSPELCQKASNEAVFENSCLMLIGGKGIGYSYEESEWDKLIANIISFTKIHSPITIVTSRRTDPKIEDLFRHHLNGFYTDRSIWFHHGGANVNLAELFGNAAKIFVTEDSAMMISESISSGKKVTTLFPTSVNTPDRYSQHIQKYRDLNLIDSHSITNALTLDKDEDNIETINTMRLQLSKKIIKRIM